MHTFKITFMYSLIMGYTLPSVPQCRHLLFSQCCFFFIFLSYNEKGIHICLAHDEVIKRPLNNNLEKGTYIKENSYERIRVNQKLSYLSCFILIVLMK